VEFMIGFKQGLKTDLITTRITCKRFRTKRWPKIKPSENFKRPKCLQYCIKLLSSSKTFSLLYGERTLVDTLLEMRNGLIEFVLFSHFRSFSRMLFQSNPSLVGVNLLCCVSAKCPKFWSEIC